MIRILSICSILEFLSYSAGQLLENSETRRLMLCKVEYDAWLTRFGKTRPADYDHRMETFCGRIYGQLMHQSKADGQLTHQPNAEVFDATKSPFADMTSEEFAAYYHLNDNAKYISQEQMRRGLRGAERQLSTPPASYSHLGHNPPRVQPVVKQGPCGACWAFAIAGACEGAAAMHHGFQVNLAESWLLDCARWQIDGHYTHSGCMGGNMANVMSHIMMNQAVIPDESIAHDYTPVDQGHQPTQDCKPNFGYTKGVSLVKYNQQHYVHSAHNENDMKALLVLRGPLTVAVDGAKIQNYDGRIISDDRTCSNYVLNHAVLLVGYDPERYVLKNSWGAGWGDQGYFYIAPAKDCLGLGRWADSCIVEPKGQNTHPITTQAPPTEVSAMTQAPSADIPMTQAPLTNNITSSKSLQQRGQ